MTKHIDTLEAWFDSGETGKYKTGDTIICKGDGGYSIMVANHSATIDPDEDARILHRAPAPKPAWHDAVAVIAKGQGDDHWEGFLRQGNGLWLDSEARRYTATVLRDVTPLIEQKVTDEMVDRLEHHFVATQQASLPVGFAEKMLNITLGLDPA